jgi:protein involved in polysaccharide export with SLBB domain
VQIVGEVIQPREVELVEGDDILTLVAMAGGLRSTAEIDSAQVIGANRRLIGPDHQPLPGDIVFVPSRAITETDDPVTIFGAVREPGQYTLDGELDLAGLLDRAGGFTEDASRSLITLFRRAGADAWGRVSDWRYPITGSLANDGDIMQIALQAADSVYVPFYVGYVRVTGQVLNPGLFPYVPGQDALFYINAAGGYLPTADRDRVDMFNRVARITTSISPGVQVHEGNELIVNLREELQ